MKETIYTIPINEAFEERCGCPLCRLERKTEEKSLDYIMGAAMMEPDVREETNKKGFCQTHYTAMLAMKNRLSLALTMESRLGTLVSQVKDMAARGTSGWGEDKQVTALARSVQTCFVCERIADVMEHYYRNLLDMWRTEEDFRKLFSEQTGFCMPHYGQLIERAAKAFPKKTASAFIRSLSELQLAALEKELSDVSGFCKSFDYRYRGEPFEKETVEHAATLLSGLEIPVKE